jgi:1-acyl-sn-glycerol-3-phosphate acyltransferase
VGIAGFHYPLKNHGLFSSFDFGLGVFSAPEWLLLPPTVNRIFYKALVAFGKFPVYAASSRKIVGRQHFHGVKGVLLVANHPHYFDSMLIMGGCPRPVRWLSMVEVSKGKFRWFFRWIGAVPLDRRRADPGAVRQMVKLLKQGEVVGIYPEGRIQRGAESVTQGGKMNESLFRTAEMAGVPVIPCVVAGGEEFGKWTGWLPWGRTRWAVVFGPPLAFSEQMGPDVRASMASLHQIAAAHVHSPAPL